jgi:hypothetical protein
MNELIEFLPFVIPLFILQISLMVIALRHVLTHKTYKRGNRIMWIIIVVCINFFGPILYLSLGKEDA